MCRAEGELPKAAQRTPLRPSLFGESAAALIRLAYRFSRTFRKRSAMREDEKRARAWNLPMLLS